ncbi:hypothetical protein ACFYM3_01315 [Streptomyces massasporeus]|uniref:Uncharacterized protein n=1 Tax=Streptomyces massasporeus TaxID=67324 RepID=A0ABW6L446_9ACTN
MPLLIAFASLLSGDALTDIVSCAILGIHGTIQVVVLAALRARLKGRRPAAEFTLGRWGLVVTVAALVHGILAVIDICWARTPEKAWWAKLDRPVVRRRDAGGGLPALHVHDAPLRPG